MHEQMNDYDDSNVCIEQSIFVSQRDLVLHWSTSFGEDNEELHNIFWQEFIYFVLKITDKISSYALIWILQTKHQNALHSRIPTCLRGYELSKK